MNSKVKTCDSNRYDMRFNCLDIRFFSTDMRFNRKLLLCRWKEMGTVCSMLSWGRWHSRRILRRMSSMHTGVSQQHTHTHTHPHSHTQTLPPSHPHTHLFFPPVVFRLRQHAVRCLLKACLMESFWKEMIIFLGTVFDGGEDGGPYSILQYAL